jgi:hypothetical protein
MISCGTLTVTVLPERVDDVSRVLEQSGRMVLGDAWTRGGKGGRLLGF